MRDIAPKSPCTFVPWWKLSISTPASSSDSPVSCSRAISRLRRDRRPWFLFLWTGCTTIKTEHHIVLDHNITIKIEKEVDDFLDDLYGDEEEAAPPAAPEATPPKEKE